MTFRLFFFSWRFCLTLHTIPENYCPLLVVRSPLHRNPGWQTREHTEERFIRLYDLPNELHGSSQLTTDNGRPTRKVATISLLFHYSTTPSMGMGGVGKLAKALSERGDAQPFWK